MLDEPNRFRYLPYVYTAFEAANRIRSKYTTEYDFPDEPENMSGNMQFTKRKHTVGKWVSRKRLHENDQQGVFENVIVRWNNIRDIVNPKTSVNYGGMYMGYNRLHENGNYLNYPLHLYNLSTVIQGTLPDTPFNNPFAGFGLMAPNGSDLKFNVLEGQNENATNSNNRVWMVEKAKSVVPEYVGNSANHTWTKIKLQLYGTKYMDTIYNVSLIKFNEERFCPEFHIPFTYEAGGNLGAYSAVLGTEEDQQYKSILKGLLNSKVSTQVQAESGCFVVLKSWRYHIPSKESTDTNTSPHSKLVDIFYRQNKVIRYDQSLDTGETAGGVDRGEVFKAVTRQVSGLPNKLNSGVYLMITAWSPVLENVFGNTEFVPGDITPTYDVNIRRCYRVAV